MVETIEIIVEQQDIRLDKLLSDQLNMSRTQIQSMLEEDVSVNGKKEKASYKVKVGDRILVSIREAKTYAIEAQDIPLDIVYEDHDVIVVNKESGMIVHPSSGIYTGTLVNALMFHCHDLSGINGVNRPGIVHRIDKETSGLLVIAKNDLAHQGLSLQLKDHSMQREYIALVHGVIEHDRGTIQAPIGRDSQDRQKMCVTKNNSKEAITHFHVLQRFKDFTLLSCRLETGRTHQIRVHMAFIKHPVYGDPKYGKRKDDISHGQYLHAKTLGFVHPITQEWMAFDSALPDWFEEKISTLMKI